MSRWHEEKVLLWVLYRANHEVTNENSSSDTPTHGYPVNSNVTLHQTDEV